VGNSEVADTSDFAPVCCDCMDARPDVRLACAVATLTASGLTQIQVAEKLGTTARSLQRYAKGEVTPGEPLVRLAERLAEELPRGKARTAPVWPYGDDHMAATETIIRVSSKRYEDYDDCLTAAAEDYIASHPKLEGWDLDPRWEDEDRDVILLTVPCE
jgi:transcriptional regulator with XRE-family HTH domain